MRKFSGFAVVLFIFIGACSSEKNTFTNRAFHNLTSHFNAYYLADAKNLPTIMKVSAGAGTFIFGLDYTTAEATHRTSYVTRVYELQQVGTYSPDPDTRSKAAALRRRGINLLDCCEPNSKCLNSELVENKYGLVRPYESRRYLALEKEKTSTFEKENLALEKANLALEKEKN